MKVLIPILIGLLVVGCGTTSWVSDPNDLNNINIEKEIRRQLKKPTGELTKADLGKVEGLCLNGNQLTDLKGLENLTQLVFLQLIDNQLTEVPKGLEKLTQLTHLNLMNNQLTDVSGLEKLTQLKELLLSDNKLTELPKVLEELTQLKVLALKDNPDLTKAQIAELQKALPKCEISSNPKK